ETLRSPLASSSSGAGDFQLSKIEMLKDPFPINPRKGQDLMDADDCTMDEYGDLTKQSMVTVRFCILFLGARNVEVP
ncbi:hypothetical protein Dimus_005389, partial [Dionaea muscipula]